MFFYRFISFESFYKYYFYLIIDRIPTLSKYDLEYLAKLANYFNKEYTTNLILFIDRNKLIENFKSFKYKELIILDEKILRII